METLKPTPIRPFKSQRSADAHSRDEYSKLKQSKSFADVSSLSRTSSFLSFAGLDQLRSSALFGIFERGGLDNEPSTPDPQQHYVFKTLDSPEPPNPNAQFNSYLRKASKVLGIALGSLSFIILFNQIPNSNKFCTISSSKSISPILYMLMAVAISVISPLLDTKLKLMMHTHPTVSAPSDKTSSIPVNSAGTSSSKESRSSDWSYNILVRYFAGFLGLAYAGTKLDFSQASQFNLCVSAIALAVLIILDRTLRGLINSVVLGAVVSAGFIAIRQTPAAELAGVITLVWLNVCVYGTLGKVLHIWE